MAEPGKLFLVTGPPGVGKTTLIRRVVKKLRRFSSSNPKPRIQGFYTSEVREDRGLEKFQVVTFDGRRGPLASANDLRAKILGWPNVGRCRVDVASFESLALPELQINEDTDLVIIDEVGEMELCSPLFFPAVLKVLESNVPVLASIPFAKRGRESPEVRRLQTYPGTIIFTLGEYTRNAVTEQIHGTLADLLCKG